MKLFLTMLLSSNLLFICYLISSFFDGKRLSIGWKIFILRLVLFFSLVPVAFLKVILKFCIYHILKPVSILLPKLSGRSDLFIVTQRGLHMTIPLKIELFIVTIWFMIGIALFLYRLYIYFLKRKTLNKFMKSETDTSTLEMISYYKKELNIRRNILLLVNGPKTAPFTTGICTPIIVIPTGLSLSERELIIKHELYHIKCGDNIYGFLRLFLLSLYWFNPLAYLMDYYIEKNAELNCDTKVTSSCDMSKKSIYSSLIVEFASMKGNNESYLYDFSKQGNNIRERVVNIMNDKKPTKRNWIASVLLTGCMVMISGIPVWAYEAPDIWRIEKSRNNMPYNIGFDNTVEFHTGDIDEHTFNSPVLYNSQFTDLYGNIYDTENSYSSSRFWCEQHSYVDGTFTDHLKQGNGCIVEYYDAQRCSECGFVSVGDLQKTVEYVNCPH